MLLQEEGETIGFLRIQVEAGSSLGWLGMIVLLPIAHGKGYAAAVIRELASLMPTVERWALSAIWQEEKLLRFYQHVGYTPFKREAIQAGMDLVYMEKWRKPKE